MIEAVWSPTFVLTLVLSVLVWLLARLWFPQLRVPRGARLPPMPPATSLRGHVELNVGDFCQTKAIEWAKIYGPIFRLKMNLMDIVILNDLPSIKKYLNKNELLHRAKCMLTERDYYQGIGTLNGEEWSANRKFCMNMLRNLGFAKTAMEERMMGEVVRLTEKIEQTNGEPVDLRQYLLPVVSNNIAWFVFPPVLPGLGPAMHQMTCAVETMRRILSTGPTWVMWPSLVRKVLQFIPSTRSCLMKDVLNKMDEITLNQIEAYKEHVKEKSDEDFIQRYINKIIQTRGEQSSVFQERFLVGNVKAFLIGGTLSSASTMQWHLVYLAKHQDTIQARMQQEIDDVIGMERLPTWEDRRSMPFTLACIWEMDRLKTAIPLGIPRECAEDVVIDDFFIPKGTVLISNLWAVLHDPKVWNEPHKFNPQRFLNEDGRILPEKPDHLIPFGLGRRSCPGHIFATMEVFLMMTFLLQKYRIVPERPINFDLDSPSVYLPHIERIKLRFLNRYSADSGTQV